jgi:hypothetical protein
MKMQSIQRIIKGDSKKMIKLGINFNSSFIKKMISDDISKPLGRWNIDNCKNQINRKIDFANEDHCGPCGQYNKDIIINYAIINYNLSIEDLEILYGANVIE